MNISKKNTLLVTTCSLLISSIVVAQDKEEKNIQPEWLKKYSDKEIHDMFDNPPMFYAPHTFWFWDDVIKDALFEAEQRKITCDVNISILHPEKHMIYGNLSLLTSAIENIIRNALKYTKDRIFLTIDLHKNEQDDNCLQIRVDDNGLGLPPEEFDKIFKPFYRVDETRTRATGGTGLGLTIVYNVVNEHNGKVWAESSNLGGLAVTIQLPLWKQH